MGLFDAITGSVIMKYKVETDQAKAKIKELSGEQKKAAKEATEALEKQGKAAESMAAQYAKGAAIIVAGYAAAKDGLAQMQKESRLSAGAAGVDIDALSESWGGLKTRMDLLAFAQAGHRGAWKLTTGQLQAVTEGMRALEKKGFETGAVFDKFTDVIKKGKIEGLDDFGLSLKSTGDQSQDLKVLMNALGREVLDVGGNFDKTGDSADRAIVKMEDGLSRLRVAVGKAANAFLDLGVAIGDGLGKLVYGDLPTDVGTGGRADAYALALSRRRGGISGAKAGGAEGILDSATSYLPGPTFDRQLFGATDADRAAGRTLSNFKAQVNRALNNWGPLATANPEEFKNLVAGLPENWRAVDDQLAKNVDTLTANLQKKFDENILKIGRDIAGGFEASWNTMRERHKSDQRRKGAAAAAKNKRSLVGKIGDEVDAFMGFAQFTIANENAAADAKYAADQQRLAEQQRWAATMEQNRRWAVDQADAAASASKAREQSFLESTFGKIEEFDQYAAAFDTLKSAVTSGFNAWITGAESVGTAVRRSIAQALGGYAIEMAGMALVSAAHGVYHLTNPLTAAQGAGELAAAAKYTAAAIGLGTLAKLASPAGNGAPATGGSASGGRAGRNQDHRGASDGGGARTVGQSTVIVLGSDYGDDSRRVRERNAYAAFTRTSTVYQPPRGAAA